MPDLKAKEYKQFEDIKKLEMMEVNIGVLGNFPQFLITPNGEIFRR